MLLGLTGSNRVTEGVAEGPEGVEVEEGPLPPPDAAALEEREGGGRGGAEQGVVLAPEHHRELKKIQAGMKQVTKLEARLEEAGQMMEEDDRQLLVASLDNKIRDLTTRMRALAAHAPLPPDLAPLLPALPRSHGGDVDEEGTLDGEFAGNDGGAGGGSMGVEVGADGGRTPTEAMEDDVPAEGVEDARAAKGGAGCDERTPTKSLEGLCGSELWDEYCRMFAGAAMERDTEGYNELEREILFGDASPLGQSGGSSCGGKAGEKGAGAGSPTDAVYAAAREILVTECTDELGMTEMGRQILGGDYRVPPTRAGFRAFCDFYDG